jgi:single-strand DNA-binding protein
MNAITITGNLVAKPTSVKTKSGKALVNFRLGNNELVKGESVSNGFFDVVVFGPQAENCLASLRKGERVSVTGRLQHSTYERPDGSKGGRTQLMAAAVALSLEFAPAKRPKKKK